VVIAPNWLGDAVMALPLIADLHREWSDTHLTVAGRPSIAALFEMVDEVDDVIRLHGGGALSAMRAAKANTRSLAHGNFDAALLLPNSFASAWIAFSAAIPQRWGFRADLRGSLLTRAIKRPAKDLHQSTYYQTLASELGLVPGPRYARVVPSEKATVAARALLAEAGVTSEHRFVAMAPGAAYGRAKQWLPERYAELARLVAAERGAPSVLVGSTADAGVCREIAAAASGTINLAGRTELPTLGAVLAFADAVVSNDSGAMHLAAAVGGRVVAVFGATNEKKSAPLVATGEHPPATIVATDVWCRPCMLRECPIDHRCMTRIGARDVFEKLP
jgi:lipopolysaccharide heptosyltransferase II